MNGGSIEDDAPWARAADVREAGLPRLGPYPVAGLLRRARRIAGLSQRELARRVGVSPSTVGRIESGAIVPVLPVLARLLAVAGLWLAVVDDQGHIVPPMRDIDDTRNGGGRLYPSHLDTILDPRHGDWWGDRYGLARPPETFHRDRARRDAQRDRSVYSVREIWSYGLGDMSAMPPDDLGEDGTAPPGQPAPAPAPAQSADSARDAAPATAGERALHSDDHSAHDKPAPPTGSPETPMPSTFPVGFRRRRRRP